MKVLAVSLLRIGDVLQQLPLLQGLYRKHDNAEVHLLLNQQCEGILPLLESMFENVVFFDRDTYLKSVSAASSLAERVSAVQNSMPHLPKFDIIYNFSHTRLSVDVISGLSASEVVGIHRNSEGSIDLKSNRWLQYYNECFSGNHKSFFHGNEILGNAFEIQAKRSEVLYRSSNLMLIQCFTSDRKKNWPLAKFKDLKEEIQRNYPESQIKILCAPIEKEELLRYFSEREIISCSFLEAYVLLQEAQVLISVDTSIKHLGVLAGTPVVEINLGGSDVIKTGAYANDTWSVQAQVACYPCVHSQGCSQMTQICAEDISIKKVYELVQMSLQKRSLPQSESVFHLVWKAYLSQTSLSKNRESRFNDAKRIADLANRIQDFEDSLVIVKNRVQSRGTGVSTEALMPSLLLLREALVQDHGNYLGSLKAVFSDRYVDAEDLFSKIFKELAKAKELVSLHLSLFNELDQNGSREAHDAP